jgi:catechol 2,3-dioxygenase-like lactoylglutathione lyase family enzyme
MTTSTAPGAPGVGTGQVLHLNLNTTDIEAAARFYETVFGLDLKMKSSGDEGDWRFHGIEEPVSSAGWFLYDDRGARTSPAIELVEWYRPVTAGSAYPSLVHRGMTSLRLRVPTLDGLAEAVEAAGGTVVGPLGDGLLVRDLDGVHLELLPGTDPAVTGTRIDGSRVGCADLGRSLEWYARLGFAVTAPVSTGSIDVDGSSVRLTSVPVALPSGSVTLELTQWLDPVAEDPAHARLWYRGMVRLAVSVEDLDATVAALGAAGLPTPEPHFFALPGTSIGGLRVLFLTDPDGFTVELVHRPASTYSRSAAARSVPGTVQVSA